MDGCIRLAVVAACALALQALQGCGFITESEQYNVRGIPMNFIINRDGILKQVIVGAISDVGMLKHSLAPYL